MKKIVLTILTISLIISLLLIISITVNTLRFTSKQPEVAAIDGIEIDIDRAVKNLSSAIQLATVSYQQMSHSQDQPFSSLIELISNRYPLVEQNLEKTVINQKSLLFKWPGRNTALKPITFLAHMDVVPVEDNTLDQWQYPPFSGAIEKGFIWGRGTLDDKSAVFGVLEAIEQLITLGFVPNRTIYLALGHDEEIGGTQGAAQIARYMEQQKISSLFTLDEGMVILNEELSPAGKTTAIIGIAEKGYATLKLTAHAESGHSSMPARSSAIGILAHAITALEENQLPSKLAGAAEKTFEFIGPEMGLLEKVLFANRWLFDKAIISALQEKTSTAAMIHSTTAVTIIEGGFKENVIPSKVSAVVNFRILPEQSSVDIKNHVIEIVDDPSISVDFMTNNPLNEPSALSSTDSPAFLTIGKTAQQIFPGAFFAPGLVLGGTDSIHYQNVADNNYRFAPYVLGPDDLSRIHGLNERIGIEDYRRMIQFYAQLIINMDE